MDKLYVGIDVASTHLDVAIGAEKVVRVSNDATGHAELVQMLGKRQVERIVLEATGGYEQAVAAELVAGGLSVAIVNARQVRDFAKALGQLAKTDVLDARVLVRFGEAVRPRATALPDAELAQLQGLVMRRRQLVVMRVAEGQRMRTAIAAVREDLAAHLSWLTAQVKKLDRAIAKCLKSQVFQAQVELLTSVPGVGPTTAATLIAEMPELSTCNRKQIAKLAGVAPLNRDSGRSTGARSTWGGRASVRCALFMASMVGVQRNPTLKAHYERLLKAGKKKKVALIAVAHKLLGILSALLRHNQPWREATT